MQQSVLGTGGVAIWSFVNPADCILSGKIAININTADSSGSHTYDFTLYGNGGFGVQLTQPYIHLGATTGATLGATTGWNTYNSLTTTACPSFPCKLPEGTYTMTWGTNCTSTCLKLLAANGGTFVYNKTAAATYSSGNPSTFSVQTVSPNAGLAAGNASPPQVVLQ